MMFKFLLADDHPLFRKGLMQMIVDIQSDSVFFEACGINETLEIIKQEEIDILVLDVNLADGNGIQFLRDYQTELAGIQIILLTMYNDKMLIQEGFNLGIAAYLSKESAVDELEVCLEKVLAGKKYMNQAVLDTLMSKVTDKSISYKASLNNLTKTEKAILAMVSESLSSKEIADQMGINYRTVENHRSNICSKLGLKGVNALTRFVLENKTLIA